jgi:putative chitinase
MNSTQTGGDMITAETLSLFAPHIVNADEHAEALEAARANSSVTTTRRLCHFMAQIYVETGGIRRLEENLKYTKPERLDLIFSAVRGTADAQALIDAGPEAIANRVYANKLGNRDEASGDGWLYRGSGYIQLTGRSNFRAIGAAIGVDLEGDPDAARAPATAAKVAFAFWDTRGCSSAADDGDVEAVTRLVNGPALLGLAERIDAAERAMDIWP